jgi:hypothetical protein
MDNVQKCDRYINIPSSQSYRSYLLGYKAVLSVKNQPTFCRNMSPPFLRSKDKRRRKLIVCCLLCAGFFLGPSFYYEDGEDIFGRNFGRLLKDYTALYPK